MNEITNIVNDECLDWWEEFFDDDGKIPVHDMEDDKTERFTNRSKHDLVKSYDRAMGIL